MTNPTLRHMINVMRKPVFAHAKTKVQSSCAVIAQLVCAFVFATEIHWQMESKENTKTLYLYIRKSIHFLNAKFQASSHILWLYRPVCVRRGRKPECMFSYDAVPMCCVSDQNLSRTFVGNHYVTTLCNILPLAVKTDNCDIFRRFA